jgi:hypothetical protein
MMPANQSFATGSNGSRPRLWTPLLLTVRGWQPARMPWWLVVIAAAVFSWILVNLALYFQAKYERDNLTLLAAAKLRLSEHYGAR